MIKLTQYAKGAGCGCKIAPAVLQQILAGNAVPSGGNLLVSNEHSDDAAVYDLGGEQALIVTADFFTPVVDDAFTFGQVAAANALSDVYAMGGKPITAIALLGWPIDKIPADIAAQVIAGARNICDKAGIVISGGHTIDAPEPFFGLSVNGLAPKSHIKTNHHARKGDLILLSKNIGTGLYSTAMKRGVIKPEDEAELIAQLTRLNTIGEQLGEMPGVHAMTDVTGYGLAGHLLEMCRGAGLSATIQLKQIPLLRACKSYLQQGTIPDATYRNWNAYGHDIKPDSTIDAMDVFGILPDPQTNGGLLLAIDPALESTILTLHEPFVKIGYFEQTGNSQLTVL